MNTSGLTFTNNNNTGVASTNDFINGDFKIAAVSVTILGLNFEYTFCSAATVNTETRPRHADLYAPSELDHGRAPGR